MNGLELCARFSYITNTLRFCGPEVAAKQFLELFEKKDNEKEVKESLKRFEGLTPYLNAIAKKHNKDPFDKEVVEAYWIGNELLEGFSDDEIKGIIDALTSRGLPKSIGSELKEGLPEGMFPHHNFNVFYVGVGRTTGSVPVTIQNMDNCRISWGKVIDVMYDKLLVSTRPLRKKEKLYLDEEETKTIVYLPQMEFEKGDIVALHWGFACVKLTKVQQENLEHYTDKLITILNSQPSHT